jgi:hypothetical protein
VDPQIFISHAEEDASSARAVCQVLEKQGFRCWLSFRDIPAGAQWDANIVAAISKSRALVLLFSAKANESPHVRRELGLAADRDVPIMPVRLDATKESDSVAYYLVGIQWIDGSGTAPARFDRLVQALRGLTGGGKTGERVEPSQAAEGAPLGEASRTSRIMVDTQLRLGAICEVGVGGDRGTELAENALVRLRWFVMQAQANKEITWPYGLDANLSYQANIVRTAVWMAARGLEKAGARSSSIATSLFDKTALSVGTLGTGIGWVLVHGALTKQTGGADHEGPKLQEIQKPTGARWLLTTGTHQLAVRQLLDSLAPSAAGTVSQLAIEAVGVAGAYW